MTTPVVRFRIDFAEYSSLGPGKIRLLEAIRDSGSLSQAARDMGMSYRRAWLLVESLKQSFREAVTVASTSRRIPGSRSTSSGYDYLKTLACGALGEGHQPIWRAVRGDDARLISDAERFQCLRGVTHGVPIGLGAHDDGDRFCGIWHDASNWLNKGSHAA